MKNAFTLIELLIVMMIVVLLAGIIFPVFSQVREKARGATCLSNQRQIGLAFILYANDYNDYLPLYSHYPFHSPFWFEMISPYIKTGAIFQCPSLNGQNNYGVNYLHLIQYGPGWIWTTKETTGPRFYGSIDRPSETLLMADSGDRFGRGFGALYCMLDFPIGVWAQPDVSGTWGIAERHLGGSNLLFLDGHGKWLPRKRLIEWSQERGKELWAHY